MACPNGLFHLEVENLRLRGVNEVGWPLSIPTWMPLKQQWIVLSGDGELDLLGKACLFSSSFEFAGIVMPGTEFFIDTQICEVSAALLLINPPDELHKPCIVNNIDGVSGRQVCELAVTGERRHVACLQMDEQVLILFFDQSGVCSGAFVLHGSEDVEKIGLPEISIHEEFFRSRGASGANCVAVGATKREGELLLLFSHWDNALQRGRSFAMLQSVSRVGTGAKMKSSLLWGVELPQKFIDSGRSLLDVNPTGSMVAVCCVDGVRLLSLNDGTIIQEFDSDFVGSVAFVRSQSDILQDILVADDHSIRRLRLLRK